MFHKVMFQKERQVALTYLTWRWVWFFLPLTLILMLGTTWFSVPHSNDANVVMFFWGIFGIGMPIGICVQWFGAVAKWQFVDPRARLMPGYRRPHLLVFFAVVATFLVLNPLFQAYYQDISPLGPLAFALMMGGPFLWSVHSSRVTFMIPVMAVFFSAMHPATSQFWFATNSNDHVLHSALALVGAALTGWWLWNLATLHEEDEGYFIQPLGVPGSLSRLERVLQGRLEGRKADRKGPGSSLSDHWHDRLLTLGENPSMVALSQYGWGRFPLNQQVIAIGLGIPFYAIGLDCFGQWFNKNPEGPSHGFVYIAVFALPALSAAMSLRFRRVRMASELLRPANRTAYFDGLFQSLKKRAFVFWLAMNAGAWVAFMTSQTSFIQGNPTQLTIGFLLLSLAVQVPAFALGLRMAQWRSPVLFGLGCYALFALEIGLLSSWVFLQKEYGSIRTALLAAIFLVALGMPLLTSARNAWFRTELG